MKCIFGRVLNTSDFRLGNRKCLPAGMKNRTPAERQLSISGRSAA
jgi:hypothetical protein